MRIRHGAQSGSLELRGGAANNALPAIGAGFGLLGLATAVPLLILLYRDHQEGRDAAWPILSMPAAFLAVGLLCIALNKRTAITLRRHGPSERRVGRLFGLLRRKDTFDAGAGRQVTAHIGLRVTDRERVYELVSSITLVLEDGQRVALGEKLSEAFGARQPRMHQAEQIAEFLALPLEVTGPDHAFDDVPLVSSMSARALGIGLWMSPAVRSGEQGRYWSAEATTRRAG